MRVGLDFDNTLASYDALFHGLAAERGLVGQETPADKRRVRDAVRLLPEGETRWRELQALAYGPRMAEALPVEGALDFVAACAERGLDLSVVSHKTRHAAFDPTGTDLRQAAMNWLTAKGFFAAGLAREAVFFESTRAEKVARIRALGCDVFVDDLEEVFAEPDFPAGVEKILYRPAAGGDVPAGVRVHGSWRDIAGHILGRP